MKALRIRVEMRRGLECRGLGVKVDEGPSPKGSGLTRPYCLGVSGLGFRVDNDEEANVKGGATF